MAELQLRLMWEEIQERFHKVEVVGDPVRYRSAFRVLGTPVQAIPHGWSISAGRRISESGTTLAVLVEEMNPMARHWPATPFVVAGGIHL